MLSTQRIDSVTSCSEWLTLALSDDKDTLDVYCGTEMQPMAAIAFWVDGVPYYVPVTKSDKITHTFTYDPRNTNPKRVQIAGQMNNCCRR